MRGEYMLRKIIFGLLEMNARRKLQNSVIMSPKTKLYHRKIVMKDGCTVRAGEESLIEGSIIFDRENAHVTIGNRTFIGDSRLVCANSILVGDDVLMAWGCTVVDHNSHSIHWDERKGDVTDWLDGRKDWSHVACAPVIIGNKSWIGFGAIILKGVTIGEGAVVAAGSVVTKDIPPYTIAAGNPARVVRELPRY